MTRTNVMMSPKERDSFAHEMTTAVEAVAEKAFKLGLEKGIESK